MTGFGRHEKTFPGLSITVEIRTVNNRHCDIGMKLPRDLGPIEGEIRDRIRARLVRGRISVLIIINRDATDDDTLKLDIEAAQACYNKLVELNRSIGAPGEVYLGQLLHFSDLFAKQADRELTDELRNQVLNTLDAALEDVHDMRRREGIRMADDLLIRIDNIGATRKTIIDFAGEQPKLQMQKLQERLAQLIESETLDPGRLEQEAALMADRLDITEECVRLESHCKAFLQTLKGKEPVGKRLGFLLQELNREANTIGSKSAVAEISHLALTLKEEIEKAREQVQNLV